MKYFWVKIYGYDYYHICNHVLQLYVLVSFILFSFIYALYTLPCVHLSEQKEEKRNVLHLNVSLEEFYHELEVRI